MLQMFAVSQQVTQVNEQASDWVSNWVSGLFSDSGQGGPCNPYKLYKQVTQAHL